MHILLLKNTLYSILQFSINYLLLQEKLEGSNQDTTDVLTSKNNDKNKELRKKTEERCLKALQREQLKKDFLQLINDLKTVNREKLVVKNRSKTKVRKLTLKIN